MDSLRKHYLKVCSFLFFPFKIIYIRQPIDFFSHIIYQTGVDEDILIILQHHKFVRILLKYRNVLNFLTKSLMMIRPPFSSFKYMIICLVAMSLKSQKENY